MWRAAIKGTVSHRKHRNCQKELKTIQKFDSWSNGRHHQSTENSPINDLKPCASINRSVTNSTAVRVESKVCPDHLDSWTECNSQRHERNEHNTLEQERCEDFGSMGGIASISLESLFSPCQSIRNRFRYSAGLTVTATIQDSTHRVTLNSVFAGIIDGGQGSTDRGIP